MFVIMFKHIYRPIGPFDTFEEAERYGTREIADTICPRCNAWKVRQLDKPGERHWSPSAAHDTSDAVPF